MAASGRSVVYASIGFGSIEGLVYRPLKDGINWTAQQVLPKQGADLVECLSPFIAGGILLGIAIPAGTFIASYSPSEMGGNGGPVTGILGDGSTVE